MATTPQLPDEIVHKIFALTDGALNIRLVSKTVDDHLRRPSVTNVRTFPNIEWLSRQARTDDQRLAICFEAAARGSLEILRVQFFRTFAHWDVVVRIAARFGHLDCVEWLVEFHKVNWHTETTKAAAAGGHLHIVRWAREKGCPWSRSTVSTALANGHLDFAKWCLAHGCEAGDVRDAVRSGSLECVRFALDLTGILSIKDFIDEAAALGNLDVLRYLVHLRPDMLTVEALRTAVSGQDTSCVELIMSLLENTSSSTYIIRQDVGAIDPDSPIDAYFLTTLRFAHWAESRGIVVRPGQIAFTASASPSDTDLLTWAVDRGYVRPGQISEEAARQGRMDLMQVAVRLNLPWSYDTTALAAKSGCLDVLTYAVDHGCPWSRSTTSTAAQYGRLDVLTFAVQRGCPIHECTVQAAIRTGSLACVKFLVLDLKLPLPADATTLASSVRMLRWLVEERECKLHPDTARCLSSRRGSLDRIRYAAQRGCSISAFDLRYAGMEVLWWAYDRGISIAATEFENQCMQRRYDDIMTADSFYT